jgi:hypothetical protein
MGVGIRFFNQPRRLVPDLIISVFPLSSSRQFRVFCLRILPGFGDVQGTEGAPIQLTKALRITFLNVKDTVSDLHHSPLQQRISIRLELVRVGQAIEVERVQNRNDFGRVVPEYDPRSVESPTTR